MLKKMLNMLLVFLLMLSNFNIGVKAEESSDLNDEWTLVWSDEFEGEELDESKWTHDIGNGFFQDDGAFIPGWGNEELQSYQEDNVIIENGKLILEGREETVTDSTGTYQYTSGKIHSQGKFNQKYGRFEASIKLPEGQGYWPAFWMMPEDDVYGGWAASGEIDIMENAGSKPNKVGGAIHYGEQWPKNSYTAKDYYFADGQDVTDFNVYAVEWEPGEIRWYVNDELYQTVNNWSSTSIDNPAKFSYPAPFDQEFYLILNLAIGGWYGGNPNETTPIPGEMIVDYVRVYELTGRDYREPVEPSFEAETLPPNSKEAIDGNYVYDTKFEKGFATISTGNEIETNWDAEYWNLVYLNDFGGDASATVDVIGSDQFAKVDITQAGNQPYSVQLIQNVTVGKGRWYKLSFDAKSNTDRNLNVKIGGGPDRGYTAYSPNVDVTLSDEVQPYEIAFQMQHDSDVAARLELNMGINTNPVWIGNVKLEEIDALDPYNENTPKKPLQNGNHVYNGTFDQGQMDRMTYWNFTAVGADAEASVNPIDRKLSVAITDGGTSSEAIKLVQKGMNLLRNDEYKLTFDAKAMDARDIEVALISKDSDVNYSGQQTITLSTSMEEKEVSFEMPNVEDIEGQLVFFLGGNNSDVDIDNIKMVRTTNNNAGVTFEQAFPLKNGDFLNGLDSWDKHIQGDHEQGTSNATLDVVDGELKASITTEGWEPWHVLLIQNGMKFSANNTYVLEFDARSTVDRKVEVVLENSSYNRYFSDIIELTNSMETFTFEFEIGADDTVDLKYLLGKVASSEDIGSHELFIDNVKLEVKGERERYFPITNGDFAKGLDDWNEHVQGIYDGLSSATFVEEDGRAKITVEHTGVNPWDISLSQEGLTLEKGLTYVVEFDASTSINRQLELVIDNGAPNYHRYLSETIQLTTDTKTFSYEFEMPTTDVIGLKFLVGAVDGVVIDDAHDILIDNVRIGEKRAREILYGSQDGEEPGDDQSGDEPGDDQSGEEPGDDQSGEEPGDDQSGEEPGGDQSGEEPGGDQSGEEPRDDQSGEEPGDDQSGEEPETDEEDMANKLPVTATNSFNWLVAGLTLIILGVIALILKRRRILA